MEIIVSKNFVLLKNNRIKPKSVSVNGARHRDSSLVITHHHHSDTFRLLSNFYLSIFIQERRTESSACLVHLLDIPSIRLSRKYYASRRSGRLQILSILLH